MSDWFREHKEVIKDIAHRKLFRIAAPVFSILGFYDLVGSQLFSEAARSRLPRVWDIVAMTSGWLPWWAWGWIGTAIYALAATEYAVRLRIVADPGAGAEWMTLLEFRELAAKSGWTLVDPSMELLDLMDGLAEAGLWGLIRFRGRPADSSSIEFLLRKEARKEIPKAEWEGLAVSSAGFLDLDEKDNFKTELMSKENLAETRYADISMDRRQARKWLRKYAPEFKGKTAQDMNRRKKPIGPSA